MQEDLAEIFISIGSNLGNRFDHVQKALNLLAQITSDLKASVIFETKAILPPGAKDSWDIPYFNLVASCKTTLSPQIFLEHLQRIEKSLGKNHQAPRWSPRVIDLDILTFDDQIISEDDLRVPHKEIFNRPFLLTLMASLNSRYRYVDPSSPYNGLLLSEIQAKLVKAQDAPLNCFLPTLKFVGILNITPDSFSDGGNYLYIDKAIEKIQQLTAEGAAVIDIGAQSTRPGSTPVSSDTEWERLRPILNALSHDFSTLSLKPQISLDTYYPDVAKKALELFPIDWINDVTGGQDQNLLKVAADAGCKIVLNHSLHVPPLNDAVLPFEINPIKYLYEWAEKKIEELSKFGISKDRIILDPGIGFGKSAMQTLSLLQDIDILKNLGCEILIGHSRKSFFKILTQKPPKERDLETIGMSHYLVKKKVDYLRVHNVEAHQRVLATSALMEGGCAF